MWLFVWVSALSVAETPISLPSWLPRFRQDVRWRVTGGGDRQGQELCLLLLWVDYTPPPAVSDVALSTLNLY